MNLRSGIWFLKGHTRASAQKRLPTDSASIAEALVPHRRDTDGSVILDLGCRLGVWNGSDISFGATIGSSNAHVGNSAVLSFDDGVHEFKLEQWRALLHAAVNAFEPEYGVVASDKQLMASNAPDPWAVGWLTYDSRDGLRQHQQP